MVNTTTSIRSRYYSSRMKLVPIPCNQQVIVSGVNVLDRSHCHLQKYTVDTPWNRVSGTKYTDDLAKINQFAIGQDK